MPKFYREWINLVPAGETTEAEDGTEVELTPDLLKSVRSETERRRQLHAQLGNRFNPPIYQSDSPHTISSLEFGFIRETKVDEDGLWGEALVNPAGQKKLESGELRGVSPGIEVLRDDELGVEFSSHLTEVSPTSRPRFQSAQFTGDGEMVELDEDVVSSVNLAATQTRQPSFQLSEDLMADGNQTTEPTTGETTTEDPEGTEAGGEPEIEGQSIEEIRTAVQEAVAEALTPIQEQLTQLSDAVTQQAEASEGENMEGSEGDDGAGDQADEGGASEPEVEGSEGGETLTPEQVRQETMKTIRATFGGGTTEEVGEGGDGSAGGPELQLSQYDDYDEAYEDLKEEHGVKTASKILRDSDLEPTG